MSDDPVITSPVMFANIAAAWFGQEDLRWPPAVDALRDGASLRWLAREMAEEPRQLAEQLRTDPAAQAELGRLTTAEHGRVLELLAGGAR